jgi:hypothetical protein
MEMQTIMMIVGIVVPAVIAVVKTIQKGKSDGIIDTMIDSINAASATLDEKEISFIKAGIKDLATKKGLEPILNKRVQKRKVL